MGKGYKWTADATVAGVSKLNEQIDANPTLKNAKDTTASTVSGVTSYVSSWFGWGSKPAEAK